MNTRLTPGLCGVLGVHRLVGTIAPATVRAQPGPIRGRLACRPPRIDTHLEHAVLLHVAARRAPRRHGRA
jgi:hypothetical protein